MIAVHRLPGSRLVLAALVSLCVIRPQAAGAGAAAAGDSLAASAAAEPFAFADFSWVPGGAGPAKRVLAAGAFTGEFRLDDAYHFDFSQPKDNTISGSSEAFRHGEFPITQLGFGGDLVAGHVTGRVMTQFGLYSQATPRNDASPARGQWQLDNAYRYLSEAYGGYHFDAWHGVNV